MNTTAKMFLMAFTISFLGTLPLGTLNVSITNLAVNSGAMEACLFAAGAILVEILIVRIAVVAVDRLQKLTRFFKLFSWLSLAVLFALAMFTIAAAVEMKDFEAALPFTGSNPFLSGMLLSLLNPLHLPFWLGWTAVLRSKAVLENNATAYNFYIAAIGIGTATAFWLYGFAGAFVVELLSDQQYIINWLVGISLLIAAIVQLVNIVGKKKGMPAAMAES